MLAVIDVMFQCVNYREQLNSTIKQECQLPLDVQVHQQ